MGLGELFNWIKIKEIKAKLLNFSWTRKNSPSTKINNNCVDKRRNEKKIWAPFSKIEDHSVNNFGDSLDKEKKEEQVSDKKYEEEKKEKKEKKEVIQPKTIDEWKREMLEAYFERDQERFNKAHEKIMEIETDPILRKEREIFYLEFSHNLGDTGAISKLKKFLADKEVIHKSNLALGYCYENAKDYKNAIHFYSEAVETARNDKEKIMAIECYSSVLYDDGNKTHAIKVVTNNLSIVGEDELKVKLYEKLAEFFEKDKDYENKAFTIDKALEIEPNNKTLLFKAGYSYSESGFEELSLFHYINARYISPKDESVQNNLGVQYEKLKMPIKSISSYKEAEKHGSTLASANLAYRLIQAGFSDEASKILNIAKDKADVHPNVNEAISEIPTKIENEDKDEKKNIESAILLRKFILSFAEAKFINQNDLANVSGDWVSDNGVIYNFEVSSNKIIANWKQKVWISTEEDLMLDGEILNNSSVIDMYEKEYNYSKKTDEFKKKNRGFLFYSPADNLIKIMEVNKQRDTKKIYVLKKKI